LEKTAVPRPGGSRSIPPSSGSPPDRCSVEELRTKKKRRTKFNYQSKTCIESRKKQAQESQVHAGK
jgi:hypothetical protein